MTDGSTAGAAAAPPTEPTTVPLTAVTPAAAAAPVPVDERGDLTIADAVVAKLVVAAAGEIAGVDTTGVPGTLRRSGRASARISRVGDRVEARLDTAVHYPEGLAATGEAARERIRGRVREIAGLDVARVDIAVTALTTPAASRPRRVVA